MNCKIITWLKTCLGQEGCEVCFYGEIVELWESHWVDVLKTVGEDKLFQEFVNATDERLAVNSTVKIFYNPENAGEAYSEFEVAGEAYGEFVEVNGCFLYSFPPETGVMFPRRETRTGTAVLTG